MLVTRTKFLSTSPIRKKIARTRISLLKVLVFFFTQGMICWLICAETTTARASSSSTSPWLAWVVTATPCRASPARAPSRPSTAPSRCPTCPWGRALTRWTPRASLPLPPTWFLAALLRLSPSWAWVRLARVKPFIIQLMRMEQRTGLLSQSPARRYLCSQLPPLVNISSKLCTSLSVICASFKGFSPSFPLLLFFLSMYLVLF